MNRTATFLAIATAALTLASAAGPLVNHADAKKQTKQQRCLTKGSTVAKGAGSRLYVVETKGGKQFYFLCSTKIGLHIPIADDCCDQLGTPSATFAGNYAFVQITGYGVDGEASASVTLYDLRTGKERGDSAVVDNDGFSDDVSAAPVLLQPDGRVAWIGTAKGDPDLGTVIEVHALVAGKASKLDSGTGIDPKSLKVSGSTISWTKDGTPKSASF
jgi:hypothetical protein